MVKQQSFLLEWGVVDGDHETTSLPVQRVLKRYSVTSGGS